MTQKEKANKYFDKKFNKYSKSSKSLGWSKKSQKIRFDLFENLTSLNKKTLLDVGSGFGDLATHLQKKYPSIIYTGYDINENFINNSKKIKNAKFELRDILKKPPKNKFDVVFSIGTLNFNFGENKKTMKKLIRRVFDSCNEMAAISMTSTYVNDEFGNEKETYFYDPCEMFSYAKTLTSNVSLYHNYLPHDFTIVLYKKND